MSCLCRVLRHSCTATVIIGTCTLHVMLLWCAPAGSGRRGSAGWQPHGRGPEGRRGGSRRRRGGPGAHAGCGTQAVAGYTERCSCTRCVGAGGGGGASCRAGQRLYVGGCGWVWVGVGVGVGVLCAGHQKKCRVWNASMCTEKVWQVST